MAAQNRQVSKTQFLELYRKDYGYNGTIEVIRGREFSRVKDVYLDHAGATLYAESQVENYCSDLKGFIYGNPHSQNTSSQRSSDLIVEARNMVARHFHTTLDKHHVIFTSGATGALKLLAENFHFDSESKFLFLEDSHTSVVGIREAAKKEGSSFKCVSESEFEAMLFDDAKVCNGIENCLKVREHNLNEQLNKVNSGDNGTKRCQVSHLFSYPAMSNFCGRKYPLSWVPLIKQGHLSSCPAKNEKWYVLLDVASYIGTNDLNLGKTEADFIAISFYKIFGFPTGVGALIIRADSVASLKSRCYYGGGTVSSTISRIDHHALKEELYERFEDGTLPFLDIIALRHGFHWLKTSIGSMQVIKRHTFSIAQYTFKAMKSMRHYNGIHLCKLYHDYDYSDCEKQGPIINFNVINANGDYIGYSQVEKLANLSKIHLRTGCFCNTGDCQKHLGLTSDEMLSNFSAGHVCGDQMDIIDGRPTGSVRISFGHMSAFEDAWAFLQFLRDCFLVSDDAHFNSVSRSLHEKHSGDSQLDGSELCDHRENAIEISHSSKSSDLKDIGLPNGAIVKSGCKPEVNECFGSTSKQQNDSINSANNSMSYRNGTRELTHLLVYPVKSCAPFEVSQWWIGEKGLLYDREWMILSEFGSVLTQKREPKMVFIRPFIDLEKNILTLKCQGFDEISLPLDCSENTQLCSYDSQTCSSRVCGDKVLCDDCGDDVSAWISNVLGKQCRLVRQRQGDIRMMKTKKNPDCQNGASGSHQISLSNESQYLLVSETSLLEIFKQFKRGKNLVEFDELAKSFRANFIISGDLPFEEDDWKEVILGELRLKVIGKCQRCQMICINQSTAERNKEPLEALVRLRGSKMEFGIYLVASQESGSKCLIKVGDKLAPVH